jgi:DNA polymerase
MILFLDLESYSPTPLSQGTARYAELVEIIMIQWAIDDGPITVWDVTPETLAAMVWLIDQADEVVIQNSFFDRTVSRLGHRISIPTEKIRDTMVRALSHGLPGALAKLSEIFQLPVDLAKDKAGKALIQLFCKPDKNGNRATALTHPVKWQEFRAYGALDIGAMREVFKRIPRWNDTPFERALWQLDQRINDRGVLLDIEMAHAAIAAVALEKKNNDARTKELTYGEVAAATQRDKLLKHLLAYWDITLPDMQAATLELRLSDEDLPEPVRELLLIRLASTTSSTAKYKRAIQCASSDGRIRGTLQFAGAIRTQRWAGRMLQVHNFPRPKYKQPAIDFFIECLKAGCAHLVIDDVMAYSSSALRGLVIAGPGNKLVVADLSNIEGRMGALLAGETWKLQAYRDYDAGIGWDLYVLAYARAFGLNPKDVTDALRQIGKVIDLSLGFQGAVGAFVMMAKGYGVDLPLSRVVEIVKLTRKAIPNTVKTWYACDDAARQVIADPTAAVEVGMLRFDRVGKWMRVELPSGRFLSYPSPAIKFMKCRDCKGKGYIDELSIPELTSMEGGGDVQLMRLECEACKGNGGKNAITFLGLNPYTKKFQRTPTYGGKLYQNSDQAASRDVLGVGMLNADEEGFPIVMDVHDEITAETPDTDEFTAKRLIGCMTRKIRWAPGLPLAAKGFETYRYGKGP